MTTDKLPTRTVSAEVVGHSSHNGKPITQLNIPEWNSKYPTTIYGVSEQHQTQLPMGETVVVMLKADRVRDGTDGSKPWHFFWSILSIGGEVPAPKQQQPEPEQPRLSEEPQGWSEDEKAAVSHSWGQSDRDTAIRRAVALKAAVDFETDDATIAVVMQTAEAFDRWLGRPV